MLRLPFFLGMLIILTITSCQVKETKSTGGLVSDHSPTENEFTVSAPSSATYKEGDVISFSLKFPYPVIVDTTGGTPQVLVTIGSTNVNVPLTSGNGKSTLVFKYTVLASQTDTNGVTLKSLDLNGGSLKFDNNGVIEDCEVSSVSQTTFSNVKVDTTSPTITGVSLNSPIGFYNLGDTISLKVAFSETVNVSGTPRIALTFTNGSGYATYSSGSGTKNLVFNYTITNSAADINGFDAITSPLDLNSGTIKDLGRNAVSSLDISAFTPAVITASANVKFDGRVPFVTNITTPSSGSYDPTDVLSFSIKFNRAVAVTGSPYIVLTFDSGSRQAVYYSGSGTSTLVFRYTVTPGDSDTNGIAMASTITANSGTIVGSAAPANSYFSPTQNNAFTAPSMTNVLIDALQPQVSTVARNVDGGDNGSSTTDNIWIKSQPLILTLTFNKSVTVNQTGGVPRIPLTVGSSTKYADYLSGSGSTTLFFRYVVEDDDDDQDGSISIDDIDLNGGTITDVNGTNTILTLPIPALTTTKLDGVAPTITSVTAPTDGTYSTVTGNNHLNFLFTVTWSETVKYSATTSTATKIALTIGATTVNAVYASGNNTSTVIYRPTSLSTRNDSDGIAMASTIAGTAVIKDVAGNIASSVDFTAPDTSGVLVDTIVPTITSITPPANGTYKAGEDLDFIVNFSETVETNVVSGYPRIAMTIGASTKYLVPTASGSGTSHTFSYTVATNDLDTDGITLSSPIANSGGSYIRDLGWNPATLTFTAPNTTGILIDAVAPTISSVTRPANGVYTLGSTLSFNVTYSETVNVTSSPKITVSAQTGTLTFAYASGSGSNTITYSYTVTSNDFDFNGLGSVSAVSHATGSVADGVGNVAATSFTSQDLSGVYLAYPNTVVWTDYTFSNKITSSGVTVSSGGASSTAACGSATCRVFDGDDSLSISATINNVENIFVGFKTSTLLGFYDLISPDISLWWDGTNFDFNTANGTLNVNGTDYVGTSHDTNLGTSSVNRIGFEYSSPASLNSGVIIPSTFTGQIGEVIIINGALNPTQQSQIRTYLSTRF